ncbi:delta 1-pyrroline-5-carboxylate reductase [Ciborinia camelliae]|nr:delta 1-pyrroline-5-carboxylate reductase [Ciborinia camelliae]
MSHVWMDGTTVPANKSPDLRTLNLGTMGTSILTGIFNAKSKGAATDSNINKFIATVHSMTSMERLRKKFHSRESRVHILVGNDGVLQAMQKADIILLACKPYMIEGVLGISGAREALAGKLVISVAVGTSVGKMGAALGMGEKEKAKEKERGEGREITIVRAMPNLAASFGESNTVVEINPSEPLGTQNKNIVRYIFGCVGSIVEVGPAQYDAASVLAAASLAFLTVAIDGILDGGVKEGIKRSEGRDILVRSLKGLVGLLEGKGGDEMDGNGGGKEGSGKGKGKTRTGDEIREQFSSPRGTTIEGLVGLEEDRVRYAYCRSVMRATKRSLEM